MIAEGTEASKVTPEQIKQVADDATLFRRKHGIDLAAMAKAIGYATATLSDFLNGKYKGNVGEVAINVDSWLDEEDRRRARPETTQFTWTNVAREIESVAYYAMDYKKISLVYSPESAGWGKSKVLEAIQQILGPRRMTLVKMDSANASARGLTDLICSALHVDKKGTNGERLNRIVSELKGRSHLLAIDDIHYLCGSKDDKAFFYLKDIYELSKTAQLWVGTSDLLAYFTRQKPKKLDQSLVQITSRISPQVDLLSVLGEGNDDGEPLFTVEQIKEMFAKNKLRLTTSAARWLCTLANIPDAGGLRTCVQLVEYVTAVAESRSWTSIDIKQLKVATQYSFTPDRATAVLTRVEDSIKQATTTPRVAMGG